MERNLMKKKGDGNLEVWDPTEDFRDLAETMEQAFARAWFPARRGLLTKVFQGQGRPWVPEVDIEDRAHDLLVCVALPGMVKKDVHVEVAEDTLTIRGERKMETSKESAGFTRVEQSYGAFYRRLALPAAVKKEGVKACFDNGVLKIVLPKQPGAAKREISIE